jgi:hypothetical protein
VWSRPVALDLRLAGEADPFVSITEPHEQHDCQRYDDQAGHAAAGLLGHALNDEHTRS